MMFKIHKFMNFSNFKKFFFDLIYCTYLILFDAKKKPLDNHNILCLNRIYNTRCIESFGKEDGVDGFG